MSSSREKAMSGDDNAWPEPRDNPDLVGHEAAEKTLIESAASGRMPHAWLITGPEGIGKATLAYRFARYLLSGAGSDLFGAAPSSLHVDPDDPVFRRVSSGGHADFLSVALGLNAKTGKPLSEIAVGDVREIAEFLHLTPAEGGHRVVVVDSVDAMNRHGANALLKILEEPPARAVLILVCHAPGRLIATIRSRCRKLPLRPLSDAQVQDLLARYVPAMDADDRAALARLAEGSPGRALALYEQGGLDLYAELMAAVGEGESKRRHRFAEKSARGDDSFRAATGLYLWWLARAIRAAALKTDAPPAETGAARRISACRDLDRLVALWENTGRLFARAAAVNLDRKQVLMSALRALDAEAPVP
jgi:DNA polymerase III subunit delta'